MLSGVPKNQSVNLMTLFVHNCSIKMLGWKGKRSLRSGGGPEDQHFLCNPPDQTSKRSQWELFAAALRDFALTIGIAIASQSHSQPTGKQLESCNMRFPLKQIAVILVQKPKPINQEHIGSYSTETWGQIGWLPWFDDQEATSQQLQD